VATDQNSTLIKDEPASSASAIENELPTYRAVSRRAVYSLICGALALFCFAHLNFLVFAVLAVILGISANIAIKRHPEMLTGRQIANAGIALGLIFGLISVTYTSVQDFVVSRDAARYGRSYAEALGSGSLGDVLWHAMPPVMRKTKSPQQALEDYDTAKAKDKMAMEYRMSGLFKLRNRLASSSNEHLRFVDIEHHDIDTGHGEVNYWATAIYEVEGPGNDKFPEKKQYALALLKARTRGRHYEWWVEDVQFPYTPKTYVPPVKPADDGHGHNEPH
jgi:hypothetical protein